MPALFVGHGSPLNAIEDNTFSRAWRELGERIPAPRGILCVSAHWETRDVHVTAGRSPVTIHDFYGFPRALYEIQYPAPGAPELASRVVRLVQGAQVRADHARGLDHGSWSILRLMYPDANVPVLQLSLDTTQPPAFHYLLGRELAPLRAEGVLILGSGNAVHNLAVMDRSGRGAGYDWAVEFSAVVRERIAAHEHQALVDYRSLHPASTAAIPTPEHYLPLLYSLAVQDEGEPVQFFNDQVVLGSISMLSVWIGQ
jgi:4,5-DOPA dioxygenase extradiol